MRHVSVQSIRARATARGQASASLRHASTPAGSPTLQVFNDNVKQLQRDRAAIDVEGSRKVDYLRDEVACALR